MKKIGTLLVATMLMMSFAGAGSTAFAQSSNPTGRQTVQLNEQNASGQSGTAVLEIVNNELMVTLTLSNGTSTPQPAHIHKGTCANLDPNPLIPLTNVVDGKSVTTIAAASMASMTAGGQYAINVHKSGAEAKIYVACGDLPSNMEMGSTAGGTGSATGQTSVQLSEQNASGQSGMATLSEVNGQLMVSLSLSNGTSTPQPAHIHKGTCANLDPNPLYPLTNVVNGKSETTLDASALSTLMAGGQYAINVHKSAAEVSVYVACGDIVMNVQTVGGAGSPTAVPDTGTGEYGTPGMPSTGNSSDQALPLVAVALFAVMLVGFGFTFSRRRG